jgi:hypothetical protein
MATNYLAYIRDWVPQTGNVRSIVVAVEDGADVLAEIAKHVKDNEQIAQVIPTGSEPTVTAPAEPDVEAEPVVEAEPLVAREEVPVVDEAEGQLEKLEVLLKNLDPSLLSKLILKLNSALH